MFSHIITYDLSLPCRLGLSLACAFICGRVLIRMADKGRQGVTTRACCHRLKAFLEATFKLQECFCGEAVTVDQRENLATAQVPVVSDIQLYSERHVQVVLAITRLR